jgi:hypothetical protein
VVRRPGRHTTSAQQLERRQTFVTEYGCVESVRRGVGPSFETLIAGAGAPKSHFDHEATRPHG